MNTPITQQCVDNKGFLIRPFTDFLEYLKNYSLPKGAIVLFKGSVPLKGWEEVTTLTAPTGYKYGIKI